MNEQKERLTSIKCPECQKEIFGSSIKNCKVNLKMHNKSKIHKAIVQYKLIIKEGVNS